MPANTVRHASPPIALNKVFHHHGPTRWKGKEIQPAPPLPARTTAQRIAAGFERFAKHMVKAMTPQNQRVGVKSQDSLKEADRAMGRLLGGLLRGETDPKSVAKSTHGFTRAADYLLKAQDATLSELFDIRARVQLEHLQPDELRNLAKYLDQALNAPGNGDYINSLRVLKGLVLREQAARVTLDAVKASLQAAPQGSAAVMHHFVAALSAAGTLLKKMEIGLPDDGSRAAQSRRCAMVKELLNGLVAKGSLSPESVQQLMEALPSDLQAQLLQAAVPTLFHPVGPVKGLIEHAIDQRWLNLERSVCEHLANIAALDPSKDLPSFADALIPLATQCGALGAHSAAHGLPVDHTIAEAVGELRVTLQTERLDAKRLPNQIQRLEAAQLRAYSNALDSLGLAGPYQDQLMARIDQLKSDSLMRARPALDQACDALTTGSLPECLRWLASTVAAAEYALKTHLDLGETRWQGPEGHTAFMTYFVRRALTPRDNDVDSLQPLFDTLNSDEGLALASTLQQLGSLQMQELNDPRGALSCEVGKLLQEVHEAAASLLGKAPNETRELSPEQAENPCQLLDGAGSQAISAFTGMNVFSSGRVLVASNGAQARFQRNIDALRATPAVDHKPLGGRGATGLTEAMWRDLTQVRYAIDDGGGQVDTVVAPHEQLPANAPKLYRVSGMLRDELNLAPSRLLELSRFINTNIWAGLVDAMRSDDSPVQINGKPGALTGQTSDTFTLRRDEQGRLFARCERQLHADAFVDPRSDAKASVRLDPTQSRAWFCVELEIGQDNQVRVSQPLVCSYALVPASE